MSHRIILGSLIAILLVTANSFAVKAFSTGTKGYVIIEVEDLPHSEGWVKKSSQNGYTGSGYLQWTGHKHDCNFYAQPKGPHGTDITGNCQGPESDFLKFKVQITQPGTYTLNVRNFHSVAEVGHGGWLATVSPEYKVLGCTAPPGERYIYKVVNANVNQWSWVTTNVWVFQTYSLQPGVYEFYHTARDPQWIADRIYVAGWIGREEIAAAASNKNTIADEMIEVGAVEIERATQKSMHQKSTKAFFSIVSNVDGTKSIMLRENVRKVSAYDLRGNVVSLSQNGNRIDIKSQSTGALVLKVTDMHDNTKISRINFLQ